MSKTVNAEASSGGIGLPTLLGVLFVGLKLGHVISWPWLWVLAPFWLPFAILAAVVIMAFLVVGIREVLK